MQSPTGSVVALSSAASTMFSIGMIALGYWGLHEPSVWRIGDRVVVYANATVLGGDTVVGSDTIIGGNVFVTSSVPAGSVLYQTSRSRVRRADEGFDEIDFVI